MLAYYYWAHAYVGLPQVNTMIILRPRLTVRIFDQLSCGIENYTYINDQSYPTDRAPVHLLRTDQKIFFMYFFENPKRYEHYN